MEVIPVITHRFVKSEDLNHHGTLFAGRTAEWFVEAGLMAAASYVPAKNIVCVKVHGMNFKKPIKLGDTVKFTSKIIYTGKTSLIANTKVSVKDAEILSGFVSFVHVDNEGKSTPHGVVLEISTDEDKALQEKAKNLPKD